MNKLIFFTTFFSIFNLVNIYGQPVESLVFKGEIGFSIGQAVYFGDLNPNANFNGFSNSLGAFYKKNISKHVGLKVSLEYNELSYDDKLNLTNQDLNNRNLRFGNRTLEASFATEFNFFQYNPGSKSYNFSPYFGIGVGLLYYNPFTQDDDNKIVYLRPLITERISINDKIEKYTQFALTVPITIGVKYNINQKINLFGEFTYRFTNTDYIDDVSTNYAGIRAFPSGSTESKLQDRSVDQVYGLPGFRRGTGNYNDSFMSFKLGLSLNIIESCCPNIQKLYQ
ncbi:MAG: DUF6089 family protein, partial [Sediminibacterium sp.]|nr:DUF6089 family protein [Sediminibacterium sp.]